MSNDEFLKEINLLKIIMYIYIKFLNIYIYICIYKILLLLTVAKCFWYEGVTDIKNQYHVINNMLYYNINLFYIFIKIEKYTTLIFNHNIFLHDHNKLLKFIIT